MEIPNEEILDEEFEFDFLEFDEEGRNDYINQLIGRIDKRIAELEEEERKEKEAVTHQEKADAEKRCNAEMKEVKCSVVIKKIDSFEKTASIIGECMGITSEAGSIILQRAMSKGHRTIKGIPSDKASRMIKMFNQIGTLATKIDEAA